MQTLGLCFGASLIVMASAGLALADDDVNAGQQIYQAQCSACHSNQPGVNRIGPSLAGLWRTQSRIAAGLPLHPCTPRLGPGLGQ